MNEHALAIESRLGRRRRILVVGQAPAARMRSRRALDGASGDRLARLMGVADLHTHARVVNLLGRFPGRAGDKGDRFPLAEAREAACRLRPGAHRAVILLGRGVAAAFGAGGWPFLEWRRLGSVPAAVVPHPSGVNHWWNDPANLERACTFLKGVAAGRMPA